MQALYGLKQAEKSDFFLSLDYITDFFAPDLNSMEPQNLEELKVQKKKALQLFQESFNEIKPDLGKEDEKIEKAVLGAQKLFNHRLEKDKIQYKRQMLEEVERLQDNYLLALSFIIDLINYSEDEETEEQGKYIKTLSAFPPATNLRNNKIYAILKKDEVFRAACIRKNLLWERGQVRKVFKDALKKDETVIAYLKLENPTIEEDRKILLYIFKIVTFKSESIQTFFEERDFAWVENKSIVKSLVVKTLKEIVEEAAHVLIDISGNWEEDKLFFEELYAETLLKEKELGAYIGEKAQNWDFERIAVTDNIILKMALTEMIVFPSIPVKVSINEYIELSKNYSTPKSKQFVNGMLDSLSQELIKKGVIKKSGRGLIDNK